MGNVDSNTEDYQMDVFDTYSFLIISPISALVSFMLFLAHVLSRELWKQPGDLIMMISFTELVLSVHYFLVSYNTSHISTGINDNDPFCSWNSRVAITAQVMEFCYSICFLIHIYFTMNSSIQKGFIPKKLYHFLSVFISLCSLGYNHMKERIGKDPYGICSMKVGKVVEHALTNVMEDLAIATFSLLIGMFLAVFVLIYTQKRLPNFGKELSHLKRDFLNYYETYIKACIFIWMTIFLAFLGQIFGNDTRMNTSSDDFSGMIFELGRIGNTAKVLMPLIFFFVRIQDPLIRKRIWEPFKEFWAKIPSVSGSTRLGAMTTATSMKAYTVNSDGEEDLVAEGNLKYSHVKPLEDEPSLGDAAPDIDNEDEMMFMNIMPAKIKESYTRTFLACISCKYQDKLDKINKGGDSIEKVLEYKIKGHMLMKVLKTDKSIIDCKFAIYSPGVFSEILKSCKFKRFNIKKSFNIFKNEEKIKMAGESGGGASGELFMFSFDNQFILKTATSNEVKLFRKIMFDYKEHIKGHPLTQIGRIMGLFEFSFRESDKAIKLILIENLFPIGKELILRKYDLKGSSHSRRVLKNVKNLQDLSLDTPYSKILKDLDFKEIEKEIDVTPEKKRELMQNIEWDVEFFRSQGIIDYSLILAIIDLRGVDRKQYEKVLDTRNPHLLTSSTNPDRLYFVGIIDYFQLYDFKKALERFAKRLMKCNFKLDTSSQPPKVYAQRFSDFVRNAFK